MEAVRVRLGEGGRIVIPAEFRKQLGVCVGDPLIIEWDEDEGELHVFTPDQAIRRLQESVRRYVPDGVSLVDELIAERRAEAARE